MQAYNYENSLKTGREKAFFNINSLFSFPAPVIVKLLYPTRISPHNVILFSLLFGITAGFLFSKPEYLSAAAGVILLLFKNILDKVDGQLARARGAGSRYGRFLDSISDFFVNIAVYTGLTYHVYRERPEASTIILGFCALLFCFLQCTYFIYYQVSYLNRINPFGLNRTNETITDEDREKFGSSKIGRKTLRLQRIFIWMYGWQDAFIRAVDVLSLNRLSKRFPDSDIVSLWYLDKGFLTMASFLGLGTQIGLISFFVLFNGQFLYLLFICIPVNVYVVSLIVYRYISAYMILSKTKSIKAGI